MMPAPMFLAVMFALVVTFVLALAADVDYAHGCTECADRKRRFEEERLRLSDEYARKIGLTRGDDDEDAAP
jgi:hypothetical protein